ncbi:MAG: DUF86 domain-containing protein [Acidobacteriota bacterium]|nr:DUF86 domain-containing protein [Acidobacteriota bacterium]
MEFFAKPLSAMPEYEYHDSSEPETHGRRDDRAILRDIIRAIDRIQTETVSGRDTFLADPKSQVWVPYHLQIVGEACRGLGESFRSRFSDPVWTKSICLRNILIHHYFDIDHELVRQVVEADLPSFRRLVESALEGCNQ